MSKRWVRFLCWLLGHRDGQSTGIAWCVIETKCARCGHVDRKTYG